MLIPLPDPDQFTTTIDNSYMPLRPGSSFVYVDREAGTRDVVTVTHDTKVVDGVTCLTVHDVAYENGLKVEETYDWYAQDADGNVLYFGELSYSYKPGNAVPVDSHGSWEAGVNGAVPGIVMLADPQVGDAYRQEYSVGIAEDRARVLSLDAMADVIYGSFDGVLETRDVNPLDPSFEWKFFVAGVGNILTTDADGGREELARVTLSGSAADDDLLGYAGGDELFGRQGDDTMHGWTGNDRICGGRGDDVIGGGSGHDRISGGAGNDRLRGGDGADTFVFRNLSNGIADVDTIADYRKADLDVIKLPEAIASISAEAFVNGTWQLTLSGDGDIIRLGGVADKNGDGHILDQLFIL